MLKFTNFVTNALNKKDHVIALFCDLRKAFDTVDHEILLKKLNKFGIKGSAHRWFVDYLKNRHQFVIINSKCSSLLELILGVPQGSILGPLLFLLYINDLPDCSLLSSILFADDANAYASGSNIAELTSFVNAEFHKISLYFRSHKMALHPAKTKYILFTNSKLVEDAHIEIFINNNNLNEFNPILLSKVERVTVDSETPAMKFLGVSFDPKLNFKHHVKLLSSKLSRSLYILRTVKNVLSQKALRTIYFSIFHCHLIYAIQIWSCANDGLLNEIFIKQKQAIRLINGAKYNAHTEPLFKKSGILPLRELSQFFKLQFIQQFKQGHLPVSLKDTWILNSARRREEDEEHRVYEMRNFDDFYIPFSRLSSLDRLPLTSFPKLWNNFTSHEIKLIRNKIQFNSKLKEHFLNNLLSTFTCTRLTCQACNPYNI
jgi:hypothetical protein